MKKTERFMLDTNIASFIIRGGNARLQKHLQRVPVNALCISTITQGELLFGLERKPEATALKKLVHNFLTRPGIFPWDSDAAGHYGILRAALEKAGTPLGSLDTMIAAHALSKKAVLVTNDNAFSHVKGLKIQDWTA
jgi:tRNA(fMet)-specific endonuclease VapC